jgi:hypothetical protein
VSETRQRKISPAPSPPCSRVSCARAGPSGGRGSPRRSSGRPPCWGELRPRRPLLVRPVARTPGRTSSRVADARGRDGTLAGGAPPGDGPAATLPSARGGATWPGCLLIIHRADETDGRPLVPQCGRDGPVGTRSASDCRFSREAALKKLRSFMLAHWALVHPPPALDAVGLRGVANAARRATEPLGPSPVAEPGWTPEARFWRAACRRPSGRGPARASAGAGDCGRSSKSGTLDSALLLVVPSRRVGWAGDTLASGPEAAVAPGHGACGMRRLDGTDRLTPLREPCVTAQPPKRSALRVIPRDETAARTVRAARQSKASGRLSTGGSAATTRQRERPLLAINPPKRAAVAPHGHTGCVRWRACAWPAGRKWSSTPREVGLRRGVGVSSPPGRSAVRRLGDREPVSTAVHRETRSRGRAPSASGAAGSSTRSTGRTECARCGIPAGSDHSENQRDRRPAQRTGRRPAAAVINP